MFEFSSHGGAVEQKKRKRKEKRNIKRKLKTDKKEKEKRKKLKIPAFSRPNGCSVTKIKDAI